MQNQYVADVGDFGKYGLLRFLCPRPCKLGVVWCLYPDETHKSDGRHIAYLQRDDFRQCDPALFKGLRSMIDANRRIVNEIERRRILPNAVFFNELLDFERPRIEARRAWFGRAFDRTKNCDAVFFDPDNGLEIASCARSSKTAGKFVFLDELAPFVARGQTVIVYHHLCRRDSHLNQIRQRAAQLRALHPHDVIALRFRSYSARVYFILTTGGSHPAIDQRVNDFLATPWRNHFERV